MAGDTSEMPLVPNVVSRTPADVYRISTAAPGVVLQQEPTRPPTTMSPLGCTRTEEMSGSPVVKCGLAGMVVDTTPLVPKVVSSLPVGRNRANITTSAESMLAEAVPATTISPLDCIAAALGEFAPLGNTDAIVVPTSFPAEVYCTRPKNPRPGRRWDWGFR